MEKNILIIFLLSVLCLIGLDNSKSIHKEKYSEYIIDSIVDLHQDTLIIPIDRLIRFMPNGIIRNGVVIFQKGEYFVEATKKQRKCIVIGDTTEIIIDGNIRLLSNDLNSYNLLLLKGNNIIVKGMGTISGDKFEHLGKDGEWGHGIQVSGSGKVVVKNITVKNCWGDCIYIRNKKANVTIDGCILDNGRRQGISITAADSVLIRNTLIKNVSGKSPQCAIDVEPNVNDTIVNIIIDNVKIKDCKGGIVASSRSKNSYVGNVIVENCNVEGYIHYPYYFSTLPKVSISNCKAGPGRLNITYKNVQRFVQKNNKIAGFKEPVTLKK